MKPEPSAKQREILSCLKEYIEEQGFPPSVREICAAVGLKSTASVHAHMNRLEELGYIRRDSDRQRAIEILDDDFRPSFGAREELASEDTSHPASEYVNVPLVGRVAAGEPLLAVEHIETYFPLPVDRLPNAQTFLLEVHGESMINAGIFDGDYCLVEQTSTASNGEMVVALLEDAATVKTFYREDGFVRLQPENDHMDPIIVHEGLQILGRVIGVMRFF